MDDENPIQYQEIERIIKTDQSLRKNDDIIKLGDYMRNHFELFDNIDNITISNYLKSDNLKYFELKDIILKIYSMCHEFYCIIDGQIGLYIKTQSEKQPMSLVKVLNKGEYFGTFNLISNSLQLMQSTCESNKATLIEISKEFFDSQLKENEERIISIGINQFKKMPLFKNHPYYILKNIYLSSFQVSLIKNNFVFKENDDIHAIYVIKKGEFSIYKNFEWDQKQTNQIYLKKSTFQKQIKVSVMVEGQIFGEEDLVQGQTSRSYTAMCESSEGELYVIRSQVFLQKIYSNNVSKRTIKELLQQKNALFQERINSIQTQYVQKQSPRFNRTSPDQEQEGEKVVLPFNSPNHFNAFKNDNNNNQVYNQNKNDRIENSNNNQNGIKVIGTNPYKDNQLNKNNIANKSQIQERAESANMGRTSRTKQFYNNTKIGGEYEKILERRMTPFKQLEKSLFGQQEEIDFDKSYSLDKRKQSLQFGRYNLQQQQQQGVILQAETQPVSPQQLQSQSNSISPSRQKEMFSFEVDDKQKILLKQKQKQYYNYQNYLKDNKQDDKNNKKIDNLLRKTGYKRVDNNTVEKQSANEYDFIKIRPSIRLQSLDQSFKYFYCQENQQQQQQLQQNQQPTSQNKINTSPSPSSSSQRFNQSNVYFQQMNNNDDHDNLNLLDNISIQLQQNQISQNKLQDHQEQQIQLTNNDQEILQENNIHQQDGYHYDQNQDIQRNTSQSYTKVIENLTNQGILLPSDQTTTTTTLATTLETNQIQSIQFIPNSQQHIPISQERIENDDQIQINSLFQNEFLRNNNIIQESKNNYVITEIEEEDRVSTQQSHKRRLKTDSQYTNQEYSLQSYYRQPTLSPIRIDKQPNQLFNNKPFQMFNFNDRLDDEIIFNFKSKTQQDIEQINQDYSHLQSIHNITQSHSKNDYGNKQNQSNLQNSQIQHNKRSQSTKRSPTPQSNIFLSPDNIYSKDFIHSQLQKFTLSSTNNFNNNNNNNTNNIYNQSNNINNNNNMNNQQNILPHLTDSFKKYNGYKIDTQSLGQSRKNSPPPAFSPPPKSRIEQRIITSKEEQKRNLFLQLHLHNYERKMNTTNLVEAIKIKNFKTQQKILI